MSEVGVAEESGVGAAAPKARGRGLGIGLPRYVIPDTALGTMPSAEVVAAFAPTLQRYLADPVL